MENTFEEILQSDFLKIKNNVFIEKKIADALLGVRLKKYISFIEQNHKKKITFVVGEDVINLFVDGILIQVVNEKSVSPNLMNYRFSVYWFDDKIIIYRSSIYQVILSDLKKSY